MKQLMLKVFMAAVVIAQLQGCAPVVVGGAATGAAAVHDRRTAATVLEDQNIELKALKVGYDNPDLGQHSNISVTSYNTVVLLTGEADSREVSRRFAELVSQIDRVKKVYNEVAVGPSGSLLDRTNDAYLTSKVKVALFNVKLEGFDPTRVKVVTSQGVVFLMGLLTAQEADAVVEEVRVVTGVLRVVKLFEQI